MAYLYDLTDTWNAAGTVFNAIKMNVTNSASAAGSKIVSLQVGSTDRFTVDKDGNGYFSGTLQAVGAISFPNAYLSGNSGTIGMQDNTASILAYNGTGSGGITNTLRFITGASERMRINSSGNVGIGTSSPASLLHLGTTVPEIRFDDTDVSGVVQLRQSGAAFSITVDPTNVDASSNFQVAVDGSERMRIDSSGNVGIGTSSPSYRLQAVSASDYQGYFRNSTSNTGVLIGGISGAGTLTSDSSGTPLVFGIGGTERMRIAADGRVGIGSTSPNAELQVYKNSANAPCIIRAQNGSGGNSFDYAGYALDAVDHSAGIVVWGTGSIRAGQMWVQTNTATPIVFGVNDSEKMRIDSSGNVGIGTSSPKTRLQASAATTKNAPTLGSATDAPFYLSNSDTAYGLVIGNSSADGHVWFQAQRTDSTATAYNITLNEAGGNVGIGISSPSGKLDVRGATGTTAIINSYNDSTTGNVYSYFSNLQNNGNSTSSYHYAGVTQGVNIWYLYGNGTSSWSSDQRLKKNIESTRDGYLDDLCQLRVVKYNWHTDADDKPRELGLIAQEVEAVFPGLVEEALQDIDDTGIRYKVLKGSVLPYMLLKALQEANAKIEALTARVAQLEGN